MFKIAKMEVLKIFRSKLFLIPLISLSLLITITIMLYYPANQKEDINLLEVAAGGAHVVDVDGDVDGER